MKSIYYTRHGQTKWNVENKICGTTDSSLTDLGRAQALELAKKIKESNIKIDKILYSPLSRAKDTALIISEYVGIEAVEEERLIEQAFGKWEGTPRDGKEFLKARGNFIDSYDGGESMFKLCQRIYNLLDDLSKDDKVYLLVAHNGLSRMIHSYFNDMTNEEYTCFGMKNCEIVKYEFK